MRPGHPLRVALTGPDEGRATFAIHLCSALAARGVTAIYIAAADFPAAAEPAAEVLATEVLLPLGPDGTLRYREGAGGGVQRADADCVVVVDGPTSVHEVPGRWDEVLLLEAGPVTDDGRAGCVAVNDDPEHPQLRRIGGQAQAQVRLFSYGTLQLPAVQQATFGRVLLSAADELPGYEAGTMTIGDPDVVAASGSNQHPVARPSRVAGTSVSGTVLAVSAEDLAAADVYEVDDYRRVLVRLASGADAWAYVAAR